MAERGPNEKRLQEIFTSLVQRQIGESLAQVEDALKGWRAGERTVLAAHAEVLRHTARTNVLSNRVARAGLEGPGTLLRTALDAGLIATEEFTSLTGKQPEDVPPFPSLDEEAARVANPELPEKQGVMTKLLEDGPVLVHLDPRADDVAVPAHHRGEARLVLRFGYNLQPPILDLGVDEDGLTGTLTFRGVPFRCSIPWDAIFALVGEEGRGLVWAEDVPPELVNEYASTREGGGRGPEAGKSPPPPPGGDKPPEGDKPKRGGHLKLV